MEDVDTSAETTTVTKPVPLRVSDAALVQVMSILNAEDEPDSLGLRVAVTGTRGVEYAYDLFRADRVRLTASSSTGITLACATVAPDPV